MGVSRVLAACIVCASGLVAAVTTTGTAASSSDPNAAKVGATTSAVGACLSSPGEVLITWTGAVDFVAGPNPHFTIDQLRIANYGTSCRGRNYRIAIADSAGALSHQSIGVVPNQSNFTISLPDVNATAIHHVTLVLS